MFARRDVLKGVANPSSTRYDEADAKLAWVRTQKFFGETL